MSQSSLSNQRNTKLQRLYEELVNSTNAFKGIQDMLGYQYENALPSENVFYTLGGLIKNQERILRKLNKAVYGEV